MNQLEKRYGIITAICMVVGIVIGSILALMRLSNFKIGKFKPLSAIATVYTEVVRDTPLLVQLYFFYFLIPMIFPGVDLGKVFSVALALCLNSGAYVAEIFRSGIMSVDKGQFEAGRSLGFNYFQMMRYVVKPETPYNISFKNKAITEKVFTLSPNLWIFMPLSVGEMADKLPAYIAETAALINVKYVEQVAAEIQPQREPVSFAQFLKFGDKARNGFELEENKWKYVKSIQSMASVVPMISCSTLRELAAACRRLAQS